MSTLTRLVNNWIGFSGFLMVALIGAAAILAPWVAPYDPAEFHMADRYSPPSRTYWFGTDQFGRDVFSRVVYGARVSLWVGLVAAGIGALGGGIVGLVAGYWGGRVDNILMRLMDIMLAFPAMLLALAIVAVLGPGIGNTMIAVGIIYIPRFARVMRGSVLSVKEWEFIQAARAVGASHLRTLTRHILPNSMAPFIVQFTLTFSAAMLVEAALSFLGLGIQPPAASWGTMLNDGRRFLEVAPWISVFPGITISLAVLGFNLFGDGLRDVLDPKSRGR